MCAGWWPSRRRSARTTSTRACCSRPSSTRRSASILEDYDALICPTFAVPALPAEYDTGDAIEVNGKPAERWLDVMMTLPFNIASRCPVLNVPSGLSRDGVPTGLAVVGKTYDDVTAFRVAAAHEARLPWLTARRRRGPRYDAASALRALDGRGPAIPRWFTGHARELAGSAVQSMGVPARAGADPERADRQEDRRRAAAAQGRTPSSRVLRSPGTDAELTVARVPRPAPGPTASWSCTAAR